eukprot:scaffold2385_cov178-Amphora_coffeaeformis.AAC.14
MTYYLVAEAAAVGAAEDLVAVAMVVAAAAYENLIQCFRGANPFFFGGRAFTRSTVIPNLAPFPLFA